MNTTLANKLVKAVVVSSSIAALTLSASLSAAYTYIAQDFTQEQLRNSWEDDISGTAAGILLATPGGGQIGKFLRFPAAVEGSAAHLSGQNFGFDLIDFESAGINSVVASITWEVRKTQDTLWLGLGSSSNNGVGFVINTVKAAKNAAVYTGGIDADLGSSDALIKSYGNTTDLQATYVLDLVKVDDDYVGLSLTYASHWTGDKIPDHPNETQVFNELIIGYDAQDAPRVLWYDVMGYDSIYQKVPGDKFPGLYSVTVIPEPSSFALSGLVLLLALSTRRRG